MRSRGGRRRQLRLSRPSLSEARRHDLQLAVVDASGNRTLSGAWQTIIRNGSRPNGAGATSAARLRAWFRTHRSPRRTKATARYGQKRTIDGQLSAPGGTPIAGATIEVASRLRRDHSAFRAKDPVRTNAKGRFSV